MATPRSSSRHNHGLVNGYRSGLEDTVSAQIEAVTGEPALYETDRIFYVKPLREAKYTPDFRLPNGIYVETKGRFLTADRQKHILIKQQRPEHDIRFVFSNPNARISKTSPTTYAMWCEKHGFQFSKKEIPLAWFKE